MSPIGPCGCRGIQSENRPSLGDAARGCGSVHDPARSYLHSSIRLGTVRLALERVDWCSYSRSKTPAGPDGSPLRDRAHFFQIAAHVMRQILVDRARKRNAGKRGGGVFQISLDKAMEVAGASSPDLLVLDDALARLQQADARQCQVVEMRFFAGMSEDEIAEVLSVSSRTVNREWRMARAWLYKEIYG
jgi:RNA polymerase sigma factor (sigma-70 family)